MTRILPALLAILAACNVPRPGGGGLTVGASFPHPGGWSEGEAHGAAALADGVPACVACHREGAADARPCTACHAIWPHPAGFRDGSVHGAAACEEGTAGCLPCAACHEDPELVAARDHACTSCHASYPHADGWSHGAWAAARGEARAPCGACHGDDKGDPTSFCGTCHAAWPHAVGYADPSAHGADWREAPSSCSTCHGAQGEGTATSPACSRCHAGFPHPDGWSHLAGATRLGEGTCLACHEAGDGPSGVPATCAPTCHGGAP